MCFTKFSGFGRICVLAVTAAVVPVAMLGGCSADIVAGVVGDGVQGGADVVTIRFRNLTVDSAVDVEFHTTTEALDNLPDDLLTPDNLWTARIGVAGTGIIQPLQVDMIELPCSADLALGTSGGTFLDNDTGDPRGTGTARWVREGQIGLCGSVVTFDFSSTEGEFSTDLSIAG